jgi:integrase
VKGKNARRPRLSGFVRERGNNRSLVVRIDGKQYTRTVHARTKREAQAMLPAFISAVQSGAVDAAKRAAKAQNEAPTFREVVDNFIRDQVRPDADGEATRKAYSRALGIIARKIGAQRIPDISTNALHRLLRELHKSGRDDGKGGLSIATIKLLRAALSVLFNYAIDVRLLAANPTPRFSKLNLGRDELTSERVRRSALTQGQIAALLDVCGEDNALRVWITVMAATGARPGEALALRWRDIGDGMVHIAGSVKRGATRGQGRIGSTKTPSSVRSLPIGPGLIEVLARERERQELLLRQLHDMPVGVIPVRPLLDTEDCVFPTAFDNRRMPMTVDGMRARFRKAVLRAGLPAATSPHWLRHTAITAMIGGDATRPGISVIDAARLAGHSDPGTTSRTYAHAVETNLHRGAALADALIKPSATVDMVEPLRNIRER